MAVTSQIEPISGIVQTRCQSFVTSLLNFFSGGRYIAYQSAQLQKALQCGHIGKAQDAIRKGGWLHYKETIKSDDLRSLAYTNEIQSIRLIAAQILFNPALATGGSSAAEAFIEARDQKVDHHSELTILQEILPFTKQAPTTLDNSCANIGRLRRIFVKDVPKLDINIDDQRFYDNYLERVFLDNQHLGVEGFINAILHTFPSRKEDLIFRSSLTKYYTKRIRQSYSALATYDKISSLTL